MHHCFHGRTDIRISHATPPSDGGSLFRDRSMAHRATAMARFPIPLSFPFGGMAHPNHAKALLRFRAFLCMVGFPRQKFFY